MDAIERGAVVIRHCETCRGDGGWPREEGEGWDCCPVCDGTGENEVPRVLIALADMLKVFGPC